jgi:nicotinamide mononucleotide adenylyltransferase
MENKIKNSDGKTQSVAVGINETTARIETTEPSRAVSISPSIAEIERFISYLNTRFNIKPSNELIVLIQKTEPQIKGYYSPNSWKAEVLAFKHESQEEPSNINEITLSSINLLFEPYETIAHEYAHFLNTYLDKYNGNCRNYHTLDFKKRAEQLLLRVEKGNYGFNQTYETDEFKQIVADFKPEPTAFKIFQPTDSRIVGIDRNGVAVDINGNPIKREPKSPSRLLLFSCKCGFKIRTARNENKPLKAVCQYCNNPFIKVEKDEVKN